MDFPNTFNAGAAPLSCPRAIVHVDFPVAPGDVTTSTCMWLESLIAAVLPHILHSKEWLASK